MSTTKSSGKPKRRNVFLLLPLVVFLALAALFFFRLGVGDPSRIPSALIGHVVPSTNLPPLAGLTRDGQPVPGLTNATFNGAVLAGPLAGTEFNPDGTTFQHDFGTYFGAGIFQSGGGDDQESLAHQHLTPTDVKTAPGVPRR